MLRECGVTDIRVHEVVSDPERPVTGEPQATCCQAQETPELPWCA